MAAAPPRPDTAVRREPVRRDGVIGALLHPAGPPRAAVLLLGGALGGIDEPLGAALARDGMLVLALAYFGLPGLPAELAEIPVETVERAIDWLRARPEVAGERIALLGSSKGGELALLAASRRPRDVRAVVGLAASPVVWQGLPRDRGGWNGATRSSWTAGGVPVAHLRWAAPDAELMLAAARPARRRRPIAFRGLYDGALDDAEQVAAASIAVERCAGPVLLVSGDEDRLWPAARLAELAIARLERHGRRDGEHLRYAGAGHLVARPAGARPGPLPFDLGGDAAADAAAHADAWPRLTEVLAAPG